MLGRWDNRLIDQASDVLSIILFHNFLQNSLQQFFQLIFSFFYNFTKEKVLSALSPSQQPAILLSICQNNTCTIRRMDNETIDPAT